MKRNLVVLLKVSGAGKMLLSMSKNPAFCGPRAGDGYLN